MSTPRNSRSPASSGYPVRISALFYREAGLDYEARAHVHHTHQWYFVLHGSVQTQVDGREFLLGPEESMIVRPGAVRDRASGKRAPGYFVATFENRGLLLDDVANEVLCLPDDLRPDLHALVAEIRRPGMSNAEDLITALVVRLLVGLRRAHLAERAGAGAKMSPLGAPHRDGVVGQVESFLLRQFHGAITRSDIAAAVHVSAPHLARIFRQTTGKTLGRRLTEIRMEQAKSLLRESNVPITSIAMDVGFSSFSHFARLFRRYVGVVPSDYRRSGGHAWMDARAAADIPERDRIQHPETQIVAQKSRKQMD